MPFLNNKLTMRRPDRPSVAGQAAALLPVCTNPRCASGWLHVWRSRSAPVIEGGWSCSSGCTRALLAEILRREGEHRAGYSTMHRHRIPVGLVLLDKGWITRDQLKRALDAQRAGTSGRIGAWLMEHCGLHESRLTQALSIQWNCPVLSVEAMQTPPPLSPVPRLFMESFQFFPVRLSSTGVLYIAFEDHIDHSLTLAIERITTLRVEAGLVDASRFRREHKARMEAGFLPARIIEAVSMDSLLEGLTSLIEREKPLETRVARVHDLYWLRLWKESVQPAEPSFLPAKGVRDVICSVASFR